MAGTTSQATPRETEAEAEKRAANGSSKKDSDAKPRAASWAT